MTMRASLTLRLRHNPLVAEGEDDEEGLRESVERAVTTDTRHDRRLRETALVHVHQKPVEHAAEPRECGPERGKDYENACTQPSR